MPFIESMINPEMLGVRSLYFQGFHISMIPTTGENFKKNPGDKGDMIQVFCMISHGITPIKNVNPTDTNYN